MAHPKRRADGEPLGGVVQREADHEHQREGRGPGRGRLPDRQPLREVVQPQPCCRPERDLAWSQRDSLPAAAHARRQVRDREKPKRHAGAQHDRVQAELRGARTPACRIQRLIDGSHRLREHVVDEEQDDPRGDGRQGCPDAEG